jgi:hypothetical protein
MLRHAGRLRWNVLLFTHNQGDGKAGQAGSGQQEMVCWFLFLALALAGTCRPCRGAVSVWLKA